MADLKISQLNDGTAPTDVDEIPIARSGANYFLTWAEIKTALKLIFQTLGGSLTSDIGQLATQVAGSTISNSKYNAFGTLASLPNGTLVMVYREGTSHLSVDGVVKIRTSTDQGRNWSSATTIASEAGVDLRNIGGGVTSTGRIIVFYARWNGSNFLSQGYIYSDDSGSTWSSFTTISHGSTTEYSPYGQMITAGTTLLQTWYGDDGTNYTSYAIASTDNGTTWGSAVAIATSTSTKYTETSLAYLGGSYVLAMMRTDNGTTFTQALSSDNGASWSVQGTTSFDSWSTPSPPQLVAYETARGKRAVACYYFNRTAGQMRVAYNTADSIFGGVTGWTSFTNLVSGVNSAGYPGVVHPLGSASGIGWFYNDTSSSVANIVFFIATGSVHVTESDLDLSDLTTDNVTSSAHGFAPKSPSDATKFLNGAATPAYAQPKDSDLAVSDVTTNNVTSSQHGFAPKSPADATQFLNGATTPAFAQVKDSDLSTSDITTNNVSTSKHGFAPKAPNDTSKFLRGDGTWAAAPGAQTWSVLTNGTVPDIVFAGGDVIMVQS